MLERLDAAVLPHFQFRLKLKTLRTDQLMMLFKQPFGRDTSTDEEAVLRSLATDFANIPRVLRFTSKPRSGDSAALVQEEIRNRRGGTDRVYPLTVDSMQWSNVWVGRSLRLILVKLSAPVRLIRTHAL